MGFEKSHIFGKVEVDIRTSVAGTIVFQTETPGGVLLQRFSMPIPITNGRTVLRSRLPGIMQGHYVRSTGTPGNPGIWELYGVRIWARELPTGQWAWTPLPVMDTPVEFQQLIILADSTISQEGEVAFSELKLPVEETPVEYQKLEVPLVDTPVLYDKLEIPVEPTPVEFSPLQLPVEQTPAEYAELKLPIIDTAVEYSPLTIPVEATPAEFAPLKVPIITTPDLFAEVAVPVEPTPVEFSAFALPIKPTPIVPVWVAVPVDE